jgi:hypothetical protein
VRVPETSSTVMSHSINLAKDDCIGHFLRLFSVNLVEHLERAKQLYLWAARSFARWKIVFKYHLLIWLLFLVGWKLTHRSKLLAWIKLLFLSFRTLAFYSIYIYQIYDLLSKQTEKVKRIMLPGIVLEDSPCNYVVMYSTPLIQNDLTPEKMSTIWNR